MELLVATRNVKKLEEIRVLLSDLELKITSLKDYAGLPEIVEDGKTFAQNAIKKAATIAQYTGKLVLGEDSGLQVQALSGRPGVFSARYAGPGATDKKNNLKLLRELKNLPVEKRKARYRCCAVLADKAGLIGVVFGSCPGYIGLRSQGHFGFGYDPLFVVEKYKKTFAQLGPEVKHKISHRFKAMKKACLLIRQYLPR